MKQGTKVIFNQEYIDELIRHIEIARKKYEVENLPKEKEQALKSLQYLEKKLEEAETFQGTILEITNATIPSLTMVKTMDGQEYPLCQLQII